MEKNNYEQVTLLLVEDDDVDALGIERALKKLKIINPVQRAKNGVEGLKLMRELDSESRPFIVLLDLNMPLMNGLEMLEVIRSDEDISKSVVFVLTTSKADEDKVAAYKKNVAGYIVKSQVADGFVKVIEMIDHFWRVVELPLEK